MIATIVSLIIGILGVSVACTLALAITLPGVRRRALQEGYDEGLADGQRLRGAKR